MPPKKKPVFNFEQSLAQLESIVKSMEGGELTLEQSLQQFEQGMKLSTDCQTALTQAEQKVELLIENAQGQLEPEPFYEEDDDD
ncbi:MAG TPA: exodeoxyribonuclease VII small subunit [Gammaproteobacteria bacterium]|nr:exodeoxyribonuclease VII small subunit [Gammaproteobacteria bacterium]